MPGCKDATENNRRTFCNMGYALIHCTDILRAVSQHTFRENSGLCLKLHNVH